MSGKNNHATSLALAAGVAEPATFIIVNINSGLSPELDEVCWELRRDDSLVQKACKVQSCLEHRFFVAVKFP